MPHEIRFGSFVRELTVNQAELSYNDLAPETKYDAEGNELPYDPPRIHVRTLDAYRIIQPYVSVRFMEQVRAVVPLALYLMLFQILVVHQPIADAGKISAGLLAVMVGLMLFMEGLKLGLMPLGETLGTRLPSKASLPVVLIITLFLGIGVTFAEPAIGALKTAGSIVDPEVAPYLYALLNEWADVLVLVVGAAVGLAAILGTLRFIYGWSLKTLIYGTLVPVIGLTIGLATHPDLSRALGLAWDSGAVTTGPVTVPLVLSLGIGIAASAGKGSSSLSGFGIVTLASLFPILGVMLLLLFVFATTTPAEIIEAARLAGSAPPPDEWHSTTPGLEVVLGVRAIVPLVLFLLAVLLVVLRERIQNAAIVLYGVGLCLGGMVVFNLGLTYGLSMLGAQSGSMVPAAFTELPTVSGSPLYERAFGVGISIVFAFALGFGSTLAEPALNALGSTVENLTNGAFRKRTLMYAVSVGVAGGIAMGVLKVLYDIPIVWLLVPGYSVALVLTYLSSEEFVNVAWDSAGVTTGPVTVPLVLSMGLGFGSAVGSVEGFGILSMASVGPIIAVLTTGLWVQRDRARDIRPAAETGGPR
jgi:hypothetical protein